MYNIIGRRKIFFIISIILCGLSVISLAIWGLRPSIDFTGGTLMELEFAQRPENQVLKTELNALGLESMIIQSTDQQGIIIRAKEIDETKHQQVLTVMREKFSLIEERRFTTIGPIIGRELTNKATWAIVLVVLAIILYITWAFRKLSSLSRKSNSWQYGLGAIVALFHDVLIISGIFSVLGHFCGVEVDTAFIVAILTVLGYSVNDTIVVYDRIRENLLKYRKRELTDNLNNSVNEIIIRSLNTSITTFLVLLAVYVFGSLIIRHFILALMLGVIIGTYSSIFIASPLLLIWQRHPKH
ncbi:MAG: protein translocase subunit SecF [Candidatus Aenigmarchaeota archaeon]|nr:protein translocase subunit SecF [Candidatus Aenigmarchaeota archaeon]